MRSKLCNYKQVNPPLRDKIKHLMLGDRLDQEASIFCSWSKKFRRVFSRPPVKSCFKIQTPQPISQAKILESLRDMCPRHRKVSPLVKSRRVSLGTTIHKLSVLWNYHPSLFSTTFVIWWQDLRGLSLNRLTAISRMITYPSCLPG